MKPLTQKMKKQLNDAISAYSYTGLYNDSYWNGVRVIVDAIMKKANDMGLHCCIESTKYHHDENGNSVGKSYYVAVWDDTHKSVGLVRASGAGSVENPLSRYDVVAYFL